jgi:hypothetical protein
VTVAKSEKTEVISKDRRISLWFPDAIQPSLRSFSADSDIEMTLAKTAGGWGVMVGIDGQKPADAVAEYSDETAARSALSRTAMILAGHKPKDAWWYGRWSAVLFLLGFIAFMEVYFATVKPEELLATDAGISTAGTNLAGLPSGAGPGSSLPATGFGGGSTPAAGGGFAGGYGALPSGPAPGAIAPAPNNPNAQLPAIRPQQPGGLSAFGLDDRTPPGGIDQQNPIFNLDNGQGQ